MKRCDNQFDILGHISIWVEYDWEPGDTFTFFMTDYRVGDLYEPTFVYLVQKHRTEGNREP